MVSKPIEETISQQRHGNTRCGLQTESQVMFKTKKGRENRVRKTFFTKKTEKTFLRKMKNVFESCVSISEERMAPSKKTYPVTIFIYSETGFGISTIEAIIFVTNHGNSESNMFHENEYITTILS